MKYVIETLQRELIQIKNIVRDFYSIPNSWQEQITELESAIKILKESEEK